ncbi:MAG: prephenate dehydrogenase [Anaerolineae bacterium]
MKALSESRVTIVGLGLMGGSLAGALHGRCKAVVGVDRDPEALAAALHREFVDWTTTDIVKGVQEADIVVLATPVRTILRILPEIGPLLAKDCLLMDLGSTKAKILEAMRELPAHVQPLGGHPMCGKEKSGIAVAEAGLFEGRTFILSPLARTSDDALEMGKALARCVGATPLVVEGTRQDFLVGTMSHLPYLLACALVSTADATTSSDPLAWKIVAGGYRDTSRVAGSDVTMMLDILMTNREEVVRAARLCATKLERLTQLIEVGDEEQLRELLAYIRETRKEMFP